MVFAVEVGWQCTGAGDRRYRRMMILLDVQWRASLRDKWSAGSVAEPSGNKETSRHTSAYLDEWNKPIKKQQGFLQCPTCGRWFKSAGGLSVHRKESSWDCDIFMAATLHILSPNFFPFTVDIADHCLQLGRIPLVGNSTFVHSQFGAKCPPPP